MDDYDYISPVQEGQLFNITMTLRQGDDWFRTKIDLGKFGTTNPKLLGDMQNR